MRVGSSSWETRPGMRYADKRCSPKVTRFAKILASVESGCGGKIVCAVIRCELITSYVNPAALHAHGPPRNRNMDRCDCGRVFKNDKSGRVRSRRSLEIDAGGTRAIGRI